LGHLRVATRNCGNCFFRQSKGSSRVFNKSTNLFSVIIPVFNRARLLESAISSVLAQNSADFELIVVDDGSTDLTPQILRQFEGSAKIISQSNRGPGAARNAAAQQARGNYLAFLDSDDVWFPWSLQIFSEATTKFDAAEIVLGSAISFQHENELAKIKASPSEFQVFKDYCATAKANIFRGSGVMVVRRELFLQKGGFYEDRLYSEDLDFLLRCSDCGPVVTVSKPIMLARRTHASSSVADIVRTYEGMLRLLRHERSDVYPGGRRLAQKRRRLLCHQARAVSNWCLKAKRRREAFDIYRKTFVWNLRFGQVAHLIKIPLLGAFPFLRSVRRFLASRRFLNLDNARY